VRESRLHGSVRGALSDGRPYRERRTGKIEKKPLFGCISLVQNYPLSSHGRRR
jgi:hypothetical protein